MPGIIASLALTKTLALICDIRKGRLSDVPANRNFYFCNGQGLSQEPHHQFSMFTRLPQSEQLFWNLLHMIADSSPIYWLVQPRRFIADDNNLGFQCVHSILFFLMSILIMQIIQENFRHS